MRYIHNRDIQERICCPPDPFMLLIYEKPKYLPRFYDCIMDPLTPQDTVIIYSGGIGIPAVCSDVSILKFHNLLHALV